MRKSAIAGSLVVSIVVIVAITFVMSSVTDSGSEAAAKLIVWVTFTGAIVVVVLTALRCREATRLLHPLVAPVAYLVYALLVPLIYISLTGQGIQTMPSSMLNSQTAVAMSLVIIMYCVGARLSMGGRVAGNRSTASDLQLVSPYDAAVSLVTRDFGRLVLFLALAARVYEWLVDGAISSRVYGANQLAYTTDTAISILGESLVAVGCLLVMRGNTLALGRPLTAIDKVLVISICGISLFILGSRAEMIAPLVLYLWFWLKCGRRIPVGRVVVAAAIVAAAFLAVAQFRSRSAGPPGYPLIENLLVETSSPLYITDSLIQLVPQQYDFFGGATYLESLKFMFPGVISRAMFGDVQGTGALVYRHLIGFTFEGNGWGFALPAEAYLNFGFVGIAVVAFLVGLLFGRSYQQSGRVASVINLSGYLYPLLLSYLPYGLRSDALGELKSIVYPLAICGFVLVFSRSLVRKPPLPCPASAAIESQGRGEGR
ncbi:O-antigen polysaccharide polymerase Wzy [Luethyella okanaganae]|uniref:O-antigen polysaccharide polymerase Wzy n=1 Tax=Luethyella okanaganae TaxID=69372 RepID=A0ABW1VBQ5_9MICO